MNIGNNRNIATSILIIIVIVMSILGTTSFVLFFTHCPPSCNIPEPYNRESFKHKHIKVNQHNNYGTQLIPLEDIFNDF